MENRDVLRFVGWSGAMMVASAVIALAGGGRTDPASILIVAAMITLLNAIREER